MDTLNNLPGQIDEGPYRNGLHGDGQHGDEQIHVLRRVIHTLRVREQTLALAESCTGGKLSAQLVEIPGVSDVFQGAVVSYSNSVKTSVLGVGKHLLQTMGAVSEVTTRAMARGVMECMSSDWSVAISGIAGPGGGSPDKPVGTVCFTVLGPGIECHETQHFPGSRSEVQAASVRHALSMLERDLGVSNSNFDNIDNIDDR